MVCIKHLISYELIPASQRKPNSMTAWLLFAKAIINRKKSFLLSNKSTTVFPNQKITQQLNTAGVCVVDLNQYQFDEIKKLAEPVIGALRQKRAQNHCNKNRAFDESRSVADHHHQKALYAAVEHSLRTSGILDNIAAYRGHPSDW